MQKIGLSSGSCLSVGSTSVSMMRDNNDAQHLIMLANLDKAAFEIYGLEILNDYGASDGAVYINEKMKEDLGLSDSDREIQWQNGSIWSLAGVINNFHKGNILNEVFEFAIF